MNCRAKNTSVCLISSRSFKKWKQIYLARPLQSKIWLSLSSSLGRLKKKENNCGIELGKTTNWSTRSRICSRSLASSATSSLPCSKAKVWSINSRQLLMKTQKGSRNSKVQMRQLQSSQTTSTTAKILTLQSLAQQSSALRRNSKWAWCTRTSSWTCVLRLVQSFDRLTSSTSTEIRHSSEASTTTTLS